MRWRCGSWLVVGAAALLPAQQRTPESAAADPGPALLREARQRLAAVGIEVPEAIALQTRATAQVLADLDAHQDLFLPPGAFEVQHALRQALGLPGGRDAEALRQQAVAGAARGLSAYYDPLRKGFVLLPSATRQAAEVLAGSALPLVVHELVHAHQDARAGGGLTGLFRVAGLSIDGALARRVVLEGEAELLAAFALLGEERAVATLQKAGRGSGSLDRLFAGELTGRIYEAGRRLALDRFAAAGRAALVALWQQPPTSVEQALHPQKLGADLPTPVAVPELPGLARRFASCCGELVAYDLMRQLGHGVREAGLGTIGWDGDLAAVFAAGEGEPPVLVWRTVWDREADAAEFAALLQKPGRGAIAVAGAVVDFCWSADADLQAQAAAALAEARPELAADPAAAASTAVAEAEWQEAAPALAADASTWAHPQQGLEVPIPDGWEVRDANGVRILVDKDSVGSGFVVNVNVHVTTRGGLADHAALLAVNRRQLEGMKGATVDVAELGKCGEVEVAWLEYHGRMFPNLPPLHFLAVLYLHGDQQVVVTATVPEARWRQYEAPVRALLAGLRITLP